MYNYAVGHIITQPNYKFYINKTYRRMAHLMKMIISQYQKRLYHRDILGSQSA